MKKSMRNVLCLSLYYIDISLYHKHARIQLVHIYFISLTLCCPFEKINVSWQMSFFSVRKIYIFVVTKKENFYRAINYLNLAQYFV